MPTEPSTYKVVADVIVSPTDSIVIGIGPETTYLHSVSPENEVATIGDLEDFSQGVPGPEGPAGPEGPEGPQGPAGEDGADAPTPTDTAFTVAGGSLGTQPTFTGTPLFTGSYVLHGDVIDFQIQVDFDNITSFGSGQYYVDLPFASKYAYQFASGCLHDISTGRDYPIFGHVTAGSSQMILKSIDSQGNSAFNVPFTATSPITLDVADNFHVAGTYVIDPEA